MHHVTPELLAWAFHQLKARAAPGVDGVTWEKYAGALDRNIDDLHRRVMRGGYRAKPSRRQYIPKADGRQRPLGIAALEDKIVQRALVEVLNAIYETGYSLRDALELVDALSFQPAGQARAVAPLRSQLRNMGNAGRNGGEYYTPRPLIRAMIQVVKPKIGERIYDGACGSAGFLCEAFEYMRRDELSATDGTRSRDGPSTARRRRPSPTSSAS